MIGFLICAAGFAGILLLLTLHFLRRENLFLERLRAHMLLIGCICESILLLLSILDKTGILDFSGYTGLPFWCAVFGLLVLAFLKWNDRIPERLRAVTCYSIRALAVCFTLELFAFNFHAAHLFLGDYEETALDFHQASVTNFDVKTGTTNSAGGRNPRISRSQLTGRYTAI